jgi:hypothetical protein
MSAAAVARALALATLAGLGCLFGTPRAHAGRPMITDDARILDPKACQLEGWVRSTRDSTQYWLVPACNPLGPFELAFGGALTHGDGAGTAFTDNTVQLKAVMKPLEANGWGWGFAVGTDRQLHRQAVNGWPGDAYLNFPVSFSLRDDAIVVHVNGGVVHRRDLHRDFATWALGSEIGIRDDFYFLPETYGNDRGRPFYQLGFRYWLVKDRLDIDGTVGNRLSGDTTERSFTIGFHAQWPPF